MTLIKWRKNWKGQQLNNTYTIDIESGKEIKMKRSTLSSLMIILPIILLSATTVFSQDIKQRMKERLPIIVELKNKGIVFDFRLDLGQSLQNLFKLRGTEQTDFGKHPGMGFTACNIMPVKSAVKMNRTAECFNRCSCLFCEPSAPCLSLFDFVFIFSSRLQFAGAGHST